MSKNKTPRPSKTYRAARRNAAKGTVWRGARATYQEHPRVRRNPSPHPGANPLHDPSGRNRRSTQDPVSGLDVIFRGPRNPSRWVPHQSNRERERRVRKMGAA